MTSLLDTVPGAPLEGLSRRSRPEWIEPMLATLVHEGYSDPAWISERKLDGERCLAFCSGGEVRLRSRNRKDLGVTYPEVVETLARHGHDDLDACGGMARPYPSCRGGG
jgi:bifunctional non-homologous end joining protein LigD